MRFIRVGIVYICVLMIVLQFNSWMVNDANRPQMNALLIIMTAFLFAAFFTINSKLLNNFRKRYFLYLCSYTFAIVILCFSGRNYLDLGFLVIHLLIYDLVIGILSYSNVEKYLRIFVNIVFIIACLSLLFFVIGSCLHIISPTSQILITWGRQRYVNSYYYVYCEPQGNRAFGFGGYRNTGMFVEGSMFAYLLILAFYCELFLSQNGFRKQVVTILALAIITSLSTTAMIMFVWVIVLKFYQISGSKSVLRYLIFPTLLCAGIIFTMYILEDKMINNMLSFSVRGDDIWATIKCFINNPIIGIGYNNQRGLDSYRSVIRSNAGLSTGLGGIFAYGGLVWGIWYLFPFLFAVKRYINHKQSRNRMGFVIVMTILLMVTVVHTRIVTVVVNCICWKYVLDEKGFTATQGGLRE